MIFDNLFEEEFEQETESIDDVSLLEAFSY